MPNSIKYKKDQNVKMVYEKVTSILTSDSDLKGLVKYSPSGMNIRRAYQPQGTWDTLVIYYLQPETVFVDFSPNFRKVPLIVNIYCREDDLLLWDISQRIIELLDGADLSYPGRVRTMDVAYVGEMVSVQYDEKYKANFKTLRFVITLRKEE